MRRTVGNEAPSAMTVYNWFAEFHRIILHHDSASSRQNKRLLEGKKQ